MAVEVIDPALRKEMGLRVTTDLHTRQPFQVFNVKASLRSPYPSIFQDMKLSVPSPTTGLLLLARWWITKVVYHKRGWIIKVFFVFFVTFVRFVRNLP
jgi:hypothetical protein